MAPSKELKDPQMKNQNENVLDLTSMLREQAKEFPSTAVERPVPYQVDPGHLLVLDSNLHPHEPFASRGKVLAKHLYNTARDATQALINQIWEMPMSASEDGTTVLAELPAPEFHLPREKPVPVTKSLTRWERFAKERGIQNRKKSRFVYSEELKQWVPRHGYKSEKNQMLNKETGDWVLEVPANADPYECQFEKRKQDKKERVDKNEKRQRRNADEASGSSAITKLKNRPKTADEVKLMKKIKVSRQSTASLGLFDPKIEGESEIVGRKNMGLNRKRKLVSTADDEKNVMQKVLKKMEKDSGGAIDKNALKKNANRLVAAEQRQKSAGKKSSRPTKGRK